MYIYQHRARKTSNSVLKVLTFKYIMIIVHIYKVNIIISIQWRILLFLFKLKNIVYVDFILILRECLHEYEWYNHILKLNRISMFFFSIWLILLNQRNINIFPCINKTFLFQCVIHTWEIYFTFFVTK